MSKKPQADEHQTPPAPNEEVPLSLADESTNGSTQPVETDSSASASDASQGTDQRLAEGTSTGGFETMLGKIVVRGGFATPEEVELCSSLLSDASQTDDPRTLGDLLIEQGFVTDRQLKRLRGDFEAKKSTEQIPGYKIKGKLGAGAMATVFLARQLSLDRLVAIKILPKKFSDNEKFIERFYKEGRAAAKLNHPNIVAAFDVGKAAEHHYFVMEYVDGPTVYDRIKQGKRIREAEATQVAIQVAYALQHAHQRGFVHRDIKPKNIMISKHGVVKLADLGLARAMSDKDAAEAEAGRAYGTPYYISPEQIRGEVQIGPAADIYGLGATFYHMVTGKVPFGGKNPSAVMHKHLKSELIPPDHLVSKLSAGCGQVIEMMMAKDRNDRYHNATDLLADLKLIAKGRPPHFAHKSLDLSGIGPALTAGEPTKTLAIPRHSAKAKAGLMDSPNFMILIVILLMSLAANIVMLIAMLANTGG